MATGAGTGQSEDAPAPSGDRQGSGGPGGDVRELRLALVCYGGVSLAIYMHGVTKELHKLVLASSAFERDQRRNPFSRGSERVYWDLLSRISAGEIGHNAPGTRLRVVVDIVSGTSAGGINGIFLAKAMAGNRSQDALRKLWFEQGDIGQLLRGPTWVPKVLRALWIARPPFNVKPPLRGDAMCRWLYEALAGMDEGHELDQLPTLVPDDHELELFVPITDFRGYDRDIPLQDPRFVHDRTHRHVMRFRHSQPGPSDLAPDNNHMLAFAARATSSFPGAFPPISFPDYNAAFDPPAALAPTKRFFPRYELAGVKPGETWFIDGGVLDNFPFGASIDAIAAKAAACEVDRRLVYIEPDPGGEHAVEEAVTSPGIVSTVLAGYAGIPRKEPILDDLQALARRNEAVLRVRDVIETSFETVSARVDALLAEHLPEGMQMPDPSVEQLAALRADVEAVALTDADFSADTYVRLRVRSVVDGYAAAVCQLLAYDDDSYQHAFVGNAMRRWAVVDGLLAQHGDAEARRRQLEVLGALDLGYHERRIRFMIAALSWLYRGAGTPDHPSRADLDGMKGRLYRHVLDLKAIIDKLQDDPWLQQTLTDVFDKGEIARAMEGDEWPVEAFVDRRRDDLVRVRDRVQDRIAAALPAVEVALHTDLVAFLAGLDPKLSRALRARYLGFPFWDILVFPIQAMSGVGERDHVEVYRMSPLEVALLTPDPDQRRRKLAGMALGHFGAFFTREGREKDYLWGRLDGAERLVKLLLDIRKEPAPLGSAGPASAAPVVDPDELGRECKPVFAAILAEERGALAEATGLVGDLDKLVRALPGV